MTDFHLKTTFNTEAALYHASRPRYPAILFDTIIQQTQLDDHARLLEIAPGTGQATEAMAKRGYDITAVELGDELAKIAREALQPYPTVNIINAPFETVDLPAEAFDLVYVATALHWIDLESRFCKPHHLLKSGGHMAIIGTTHVSDEEGDVFSNASQPIYKKYDPGEKYRDDFQLPRLSELKSYDYDTDRFTLVYFHAFRHIIDYSASEFARLLNTHSNVIATPTDRRTGFLSAIEDLIRTEFDDHLRIHYGMWLMILQKIPTSHE